MSKLELIADKVYNHINFNVIIVDGNYYVIFKANGDTLGPLEEVSIIYEKLVGVKQYNPYIQEVRYDEKGKQLDKNEVAKESFKYIQSFNIAGELEEQISQVDDNRWEHLYYYYALNYSNGTVQIEQKEAGIRLERYDLWGDKVVLVQNNICSGLYNETKNAWIVELCQNRIDIGRCLDKISDLGITHAQKSHLDWVETFSINSETAINKIITNECEITLEQGERVLKRISDDVWSVYKLNKDYNMNNIKLVRFKGNQRENMLELEWSKFTQLVNGVRLLICGEFDGKYDICDFNGNCIIPKPNNLIILKDKVICDMGDLYEIDGYTGKYTKIRSKLHRKKEKLEVTIANKKHRLVSVANKIYYDIEE